MLPPDLVCINLPALRLWVWRGGILQAVFPVAIGRPEYPTPVGEYSIAFRRRRPTWYPPEGGEPVPPGPNNPLGSRFLGLNLALYGMHGTNVPASIGHAVSRGCIRLTEPDVHRLWDLTYDGMRVRIVYERVCVQGEWWGQTVLIFPDVYRRQPLSVGELSLSLPPLAGEPALVQEALGWAESGPALMVLADPVRPVRTFGAGSAVGNDEGSPRYRPLRCYPFPRAPWVTGKGVGSGASK